VSVNRVILVGRVGGDPQIRYTSGGQAVANFSIATDESYKNKDGEKVKKTEWHRCVIWGKLAEIVEQYVTKGSLLYLEGKISTSEWEKDGEKKTSKDIVCDTMRMLGGNEREERQEKTPKKADSGARTKAKQVQQETESEGYVAEEEDIPF
jgi:single-strand DNA-binding protein